MALISFYQRVNGKLTMMISREQAEEIQKVKQGRGDGTPEQQAFAKNVKGVYLHLGSDTPSRALQQRLPYKDSE